MTENKKPFVSIVTLIVMFFGAVFSLSVWGVYLGGAIALMWATCTAALFLCEFLCGLVKKRFSKNVGAFIAFTLMCVGLVVTLIQNSNANGVSMFDFSDLAIAVTLIAFLPPMIVSLLVNIGNIIYKVRFEKTDEAKNNLE